MKFKSITKQQRTEFYNRIVYPEQFNGSAVKLIYHIYNVFYPITNGDAGYIKRVVQIYLPDTAEQIIDKHLQAVASKYNDEKSSNIIRFDCFTCIQQDLTEQDMFFEHSNKHRKVTLAEFKFILRRATAKVYKSGGSATMVNNYFMKAGFKAEYFKYTGKALSPNKITHIMQVLQKYNYLHITYYDGRSRVVQLGFNNPFYVLHGIPEVDEQQVTTKADRTIVHLAEQVKMLQSGLDSLKEELEHANTEVEKLLDEKELLVNLMTERDEEIEQLQGKLISRAVKRQNILSRIDSYMN